MYSDKALMEHTVVVDLIGGCTTLSCETLQIKYIEYPYPELTAKGIKEVIINYKHFSKSEMNIDVIVVDNRPEEENYNDLKAKESQEFKKDRNSMLTGKM